MKARGAGTPPRRVPGRGSSLRPRGSWPACRCNCWPATASCSAGRTWTSRGTQVTRLLTETPPLGRGVASRSCRPDLWMLAQLGAWPVPHPLRSVPDASDGSSGLLNAASPPALGSRAGEEVGGRLDAAQPVSSFHCRKPSPPLCRRRAGPRAGRRDQTANSKYLLIKLCLIICRARAPRGRESPRGTGYPRTRRMP